jgi:hypothetical protein
MAPANNWTETLEELREDMEERKHDGVVLQALLNRIDSLETKIDALVKVGSLVVPITSFGDEPFEALQEIKVVIEPSDDEYVASFFEANVNAQGCNQQEAFDNLKETLLSRFDYLDSRPPEKLGPSLKRQIAVLRDFIRRKA